MYSAGLADAISESLHHSSFQFQQLFTVFNFFFASGERLRERVLRIDALFISWNFFYCSSFCPRREEILEHLVVFARMPHTGPFIATEGTVHAFSFEAERLLFRRPPSILTLTVRDVWPKH